ncbi:hypothetical protein BDV18DRAFT_134446 [Aspergillus unguis]
MPLQIHPPRTNKHRALTVLTPDSSSQTRMHSNTPFQRRDVCLYRHWINPVQLLQV